MSGAATAGATCASISGIGNGNGCLSTPTSFAIGIGNNTTANAQGLFDSAISNGFTNTPAQFTNSQAVGNFDTAIASGPNTIAVAIGTANFAFNQGSNAAVQAGVLPTDAFNSAFNLGDNNVAVATGQGNFNSAGNVLGNGNNVQAGFGNFNQATNMFGNNNTVVAFFGPLAMASSVGQTGQVVTRTTPGLNFNNTVKFP
jgi:hypothetical protein